MKCAIQGQKNINDKKGINLLLKIIENNNSISTGV